MATREHVLLKEWEYSMRIWWGGYRPTYFYRKVELLNTSLKGNRHRGLKDLGATAGNGFADIMPILRTFGNKNNL